MGTKDCFTGFAGFAADGGGAMAIEEKKTIVIALLIPVIALVVTAVIYQGSKLGPVDEMEAKAAAEKRTQIERSIAAMVARHGAVADWSKRLVKEDKYLIPLVTLEVQNALMVTGGRPVLFYSYLTDVEKSGEKYMVSFRDVTAHPDILFELECSPEQVEKIMANPNEMFFNNYAVVARIRDVYKPKFTLRGRPAKKGSSMVDIESPGLVVAEGSCVDMIFIGDPFLNPVE
jgi:hypothetical protein